MGGFGKVENDELKRMQAKFEKMVAPEEVGKVYRAALMEAGKVHLANCIRNTPFGDYSRNVEPYNKKLGGTLKKGWTANSHAEAASNPGVPSTDEIATKVNSSPIYKSGKHLQITFFNHVNYSVYVDKGHRQTPGRFVPAIGKRLKASWVKPQNFIRNSENETARVMPGIIKRHMTEYLKGMKP